MLYDETLYTDPNKVDANRAVLHDYAVLNRKFQNAQRTQQQAKPWYSFLTGLTTAFIPFVGGAVGAGINYGTDVLVSKHKNQINDKLNQYREQLGLNQRDEVQSNGLDLYGAGSAIGNSFATKLGRDTTPATDLSYLNPKITQNPSLSVDSLSSQYPLFTGNGGANPTAPQTGRTGQTSNLPSTGYYNSGGGLADGIISQTQNGYLQAPPTSATMRNGGKIEGGKINAPSHEMGGVDLIDAATGKKLGIKVEGKERIVNNDDWTNILAFLKKGKNKKAIDLLEDIDTRKPVEGKAEQGINLGSESLPSNVPVYQKTTLPIDTNLKSAPRPNFDSNDFLNYSFDAAKLGLGLGAAMKKLPQYSIPQDWKNYMQKAKYFSEQGLTPEEVAIAKDQANRDYSAQVRDLVNLSGGNQGAVLGNLGNVGLGRYRLANELALKDRALKQQNFEKFGNRLASDVAMRKEIFDNMLQQAALNKKEGAGLASDAIANLQGRMDYNKFYGDGSYYAKLQDALVKKGLRDEEISALMLEHAKDPTFWQAALAHVDNPYTDDKIEKEAKKLEEEVRASASKKEGTPTSSDWFNYLTKHYTKK